MEDMWPYGHMIRSDMALGSRSITTVYMDPEFFEVNWTVTDRENRMREVKNRG